jgi:hypothetical protein
MVKYTEWLNTFSYVGKGVSEGTIENALLHFFYEGLSPFIRRYGYEWTDTEDVIALKFLKFCFLIHETSQMNLNYSLEAPVPNHRDFQEDRDTFDSIIDTRSFIDFMDEWSFYDFIVGTRLDYLLREFCYVWIDVQNGKPGTTTQTILDAIAENRDSDEEAAGNGNLPDGNWSRRKHDLY